MYSFGHDQTARKFFKRREAVHGELALKARAELDGSSRWVTWPLHSQVDARLVGPFLAEGMWRSGARTASDIWSRGEGVSGFQSQGTPGWAVFEQTTPPIPPSSSKHSVFHVQPRRGRLKRVLLVRPYTVLGWAREEIGNNNWAGSWRVYETCWSYQKPNRVSEIQIDISR